MKRITRSGSARIELKAQTVELNRQGRKGSGHAIGQAGHIHPDAIESHLVIRCLQRGRIAHLGVNLGIACVGRSSHAQWVGAGHEKVTTRIALQIHAQLVLGIHEAFQGQRHAAHQVLHVGQILVHKGQHPAQRAAEVGVGKGLAHATLYEVHLLLAGVVGVVHQLQLVGRAAQHQWLAATDKNAGAAIVGAHRGHFHELAKLAEQLVALVEQVVGRAVVALRFNDLLVDLGHIGGQTVDGGDTAARFLIGAAGQHIELRDGAAHAGGRFIAARQGHHAGREVGRRGRHIVPHIEHAVDRGAQSIGPGGKEGFKLLQTPIALGIGRRGGGCQTGLTGQVFTVGTGHLGQFDTLAEILSPQLLVARGLGLHRLARVARRVGIGNVVANDLQRCQVGVERSRADIQGGRHVSTQTPRR